MEQRAAALRLGVPALPGRRPGPAHGPAGPAPRGRAGGRAAAGCRRWSKGPRLYGWAYLPYRGAAPGWRMGLLVRRSPAEPGELAYHLTRAPEGTTLARPGGVAGRRRGG